jgi:hypothetical protein
MNLIAAEILFKPTNMMIADIIKKNPKQHDEFSSIFSLLHQSCQE